jgi:four helix bundle protein
MGDFTRLTLWRKADELTYEVYLATTRFPTDERYGLTSQLRRAANSIESNIAEGCGRLGDRELARSLRIARGSACELQSHLWVAYRQRYLNDSAHARLSGAAIELQRMLFALIRMLATRAAHSQGPSTGARRRPS